MPKPLEQFTPKVDARDTEMEQMRQWRDTVMNAILNGDAIKIRPTAPETYSKSSSSPGTTTSYSDTLEQLTAGVEGRLALFRASGRGHIGAQDHTYNELTIVLPNATDAKIGSAINYGSNDATYQRPRTLGEVKDVMQLLQSAGIEIEIPQEKIEALKPKGWEFHWHYFQGGGISLDGAFPVVDAEKALRGLHVFKAGYRYKPMMVAYYFPENNEKPIEVKSWGGDEVPSSETEALTLVTEQDIQSALQHEDPLSRAKRLIESYNERAIMLSDADLENYRKLIKENESNPILDE